MKALILGALLMSVPVKETEKNEVKDNKHIYEDINCLLTSNLISIEEAQKIWAKHKKAKKHGNTNRENPKH